MYPYFSIYSLSGLFLCSEQTPHVFDTTHRYLLIKTFLPCQAPETQWEVLGIPFGSCSQTPWLRDVLGTNEQDPAAPASVSTAAFYLCAYWASPPKILLEDRSLLKREKEKMLVTVDQLSLLALVGGIRSWVCYLYLWSKSLHCVLALEPFLSFKISSFRH